MKPKYNLSELSLKVKITQQMQMKLDGKLQEDWKGLQRVVFENLLT